MKVVFMGTGDIAIPSFSALNDSEFELVGLVTQPDKPVGRKQVLTAPAIKVEAVKLGIPVFQPEKLRDTEAIAELKNWGADIFVVMAYGQILSLEVLEMPSVACINLHASLLPLHRGASCIQAAIAQGNPETGVTVMHMVEGLDKGDIILARSTEIGKKETGGELHDRLAELAPEVMLQSLSLLKSGEAQRVEQDEEKSNYVGKLLRKDGEIDWSKPAEEIEMLVRAYEPWPGTYTTFEDAKGRVKRLKIFAPSTVNPEVSGGVGEVLEVDGRLLIGCGLGALEVFLVQPEGGKKMEVSAFLQSGAVELGDCLGG